MSNRGEKRRQARKNEAGGEMTKLYVVLGVVAVLAIAAVGYSIGSGGMGQAATEPVELEFDNMSELAEMAQGVTLGDPDAPITVVEFGDYQCPGCGGFASQVKPLIDLQLIESGRANFVFYDLPLVQIHPHAFLVARSARCAGDQDKYWDYHTVVFRNQSRWTTDVSPIGKLMDYAAEVGLDTEAFESCVRSDRHAEVVTANMRLAYELGVNGTPTVMVSRGEGMARRLPNNSFQAILNVVQEMEAEMNGAPTGEGAAN